MFRRFCVSIVLVTLVFGLLASVRLPAPGVAHAAEPAQATGHTMYLPVVVRSGGTNTTPAPTPPASADGAFFFEPKTRTASPGVAVDAQGGMHMAYYHDISEDDGGAHGIYSYCPPPAAQCTTESRWQRVRLFGPANAVQLQLTPAGKPRLLAEDTGLRNSVYLRTFYTYAECDQNCLNSAGWRSTEVATVLAGYIPDAREMARRSFALDRAGNPYLVVTDMGSNIDNEPRYGAFLYRCTANCTDAANWTATGVTPRDPDSGRGGSLESPVLRFTSANQPRILGVYYPAFNDGDTVSQVTYIACDAACDTPEHWSVTPVSARGNGPKPAWDLEITPQDQPRAVIYHEDTEDAVANQIVFFQCDAACTNAASWSSAHLGLPQEVGIGANLALDNAGRPRIAHLAQNGILVYSWCEQACASAENWLHGLAEQPAALDATKVVVIPSGCVPGIWDNYGVSLALDAQGNPRISYNATYQAQCAHNPKPGMPPTGGFYEIAHLVRMYVSPRPSGTCSGHQPA